MRNPCFCLFHSRARSATSGFIALFFLTWPRLLFAQTATSGLSLHLESQNKVWISGEEIYLDCTLQNTSDSDRNIYFTGDSWNLTLEDQNAVAVRNILNQHEMAVSFFSEVAFPLARGEEKTVSLWLLYYDNLGTVTGAAHDLRPGLYRALFAYDGKRSNEAEFRVVARPAEEDVVRERLNKNVVAFKTSEGAIVECRELLRLYPRSAFAGNIYHKLLSLLMFKCRNKELKEAAQAFMQSHPDAGGMRLAAHYYVLGLKDSLGIGVRGKPTLDQVEQLATLLEHQLQRVPPSSRAARHIKDEISRLRRKGDKK